MGSSIVGRLTNVMVPFYTVADDLPSALSHCNADICIYNPYNYVYMYTDMFVLNI